MPQNDAPTIDCPVCTAKAGYHCCLTAAIKFNHKERLDKEAEAEHMLKEMGFYNDTH